MYPSGILLLLLLLFVSCTNGTLCEFCTACIRYTHIMYLNIVFDYILLYLTNIITAIMELFV